MTTEYIQGGAEREKEPSTKRGTMKIYAGGMFSGKTDSFVTEVIVLRDYAQKKIQVFNPAINDRVGSNRIDSHNGKFLDAVAIHDPEEMLALLNDDTEVVAIEEIQFFDPSIVDVTQKILDKGVKIIAAGLDLNFRGEPFGSMPDLLAYAEKVKKLKARCVVCGHKATRTQRIKITDGKRMPAHYDDPLILVGSEEAYEARCSTHFECPKD